MSLNISQQDYNIMNQHVINRYIKLLILDFNYLTVDEISGNLISCQFNVDVDSDLRRSCKIELVVNNNQFTINSGSQIWLDKFIQPYIGIKNIWTNEIQWYNQGIYLIDSPSWNYDATNNVLSFSGIDLVSKLTGQRNGQLEGISTIIPQGSNVREAMIATLNLAGFNQYVIDECKLEDGTIQNVPYDIEISQGGTVWDIISKLRDILPNYETFFDINGVFRYQPIPSGENAPILIDDSLWNNILISENIDTDFSNVKNYIEVYGRSHDVQYYSSDTTISDNIISLTISELTDNIEEYTLIGFTLPSNIDNVSFISININNTSDNVNLVDSSGNPIKSLSQDVYYVAQYQNNNTWLFLGHQQAFAIAQDDNPESPFYVGSNIGKIRLVLYGGEYDNIMSDELAQQRANLEIYWHCRLNDNITLNVVPIPWIDGNIVVSHAIKNTETQNLYIIKSFSSNYEVNSTMQIKMISYYPYTL